MSLPSENHCDPEVADADALVREYLALWNARDIDTIWARIYASKDTKLPWNEQTMRAALTALIEDGFDRSDTLSLETRSVAPGHAETRISFQRVRTDGSIIPPGIRRSLYVVRKYPEGWRITEMHAQP